MMLGVMLRGLMCRVGRVQAMRVREMGVMPGLLVLPVVVVLGGLAMMLGGFLVVLGRGRVMLPGLVTLMSAHGVSFCAE